MRARRSLAGAAFATAAGLGATRLLAGGSLRRRAKAFRRWRDRRARYRLGELQGTGYRLAGGAPDPSVPDDVLADRVRSSIGTLVKRLDLPRVHVMVTRRIAMLHGEVSSAADADALERAVAGVAGVRGVESYLHIGLLPGDSRPSEGRARAGPSAARRQLVEAAQVAAGVEGDDAARLVRAVLAVFADRLPAGERAHVLSHLPGDVRSLASPVRRRGDVAIDVRDGTGFTMAVAVAAGLTDLRASRHLCEAVLGHLRELVPEERADVAAVLPGDLRELWNTAVPG